MDGRPTWTDEAGDYIVPNVLSPRDLVFRPDNMDETVPHTSCAQFAPECKFSPRSKFKPGSKFAPPYVVFICRQILSIHTFI